MDDIFFFFLVARKLRECLVQFFANRFAFLLLLVQYVCKENQLRCTMKCRLLTRISINEHYLRNLCNYKEIYASKNEYFFLNHSLIHIHWKVAARLNLST